jgi:ribonucleoside-diphosphate reductase alpha chain
MYYLRTKAATDAIKFTVNKEQLQQPTENAASQAEVTLDSIKVEQKNQDAIACSLDNPEGCESCSG